MICRDILDNPQLDVFDWWNDGQDTINWLDMMAVGAKDGDQERALRAGQIAADMRRRLKEFYAALRADRGAT